MNKSIKVLIITASKENRFFIIRFNTWDIFSEFGPPCHIYIKPKVWGGKILALLANICDRRYVGMAVWVYGHGK